MPITLVEQEPGCGPPAPVPILQWEKEFQVLLELHKRSTPGRLLEIGTYHGGTLFHWLQNSFGSDNQKIVTVDSYEVGVDNRDQYDSWNVNGCELVVIKGNSNDDRTAVEVRKHGPFDWLFIDAGHYYHEVVADWQNYAGFVREGGFAVLHDILTHPSWPSIEVGRLWEEIKRDHLTFEIVADRDAKWGGLGVVLL